MWFKKQDFLKKLKKLIILQSSIKEHMNLYESKNYLNKIINHYSNTELKRKQVFKKNSKILNNFQKKCI